MKASFVRVHHHGYPERDSLGQTLFLLLVALPLKQLLLKLLVKLERILHGVLQLEVDSGLTDDVLKLVVVPRYHVGLEFRSLQIEVAVLVRVASLDHMQVPSGSLPLLLD